MGGRVPVPLLGAQGQGEVGAARLSPAWPPDPGQTWGEMAPEPQWKLSVGPGTHSPTGADLGPKVTPSLAAARAGRVVGARRHLGPGGPPPRAAPTPGRGAGSGREAPGEEEEGAGGALEVPAVPAFRGGGLPGHCPASCWICTSNFSRKIPRGGGSARRGGASPPARGQGGRSGAWARPGAFVQGRAPGCPGSCEQGWSGEAAAPAEQRAPPASSSGKQPGG